MKYLGFLCLFVLVLLSGCSSYVARIEPGVPREKYQRLFVKSNFDDNHGMDGRIMRAFQEHGFTVDKGPLTMMPRNTQAVVSFDDHWNWDFTTHMTFLRIEVKDERSEALVASGTFSGPASMTTSADEAVDRVVQKIVSQWKASK